MLMVSRGRSVTQEPWFPPILHRTTFFVTSPTGLKMVSSTGSNYYGINTVQIRSMWSINLLPRQALTPRPPFLSSWMKLVIFVVLVPKAISYLKYLPTGTSIWSPLIRKPPCISTMLSGLGKQTQLRGSRLNKMVARRLSVSNMSPPLTTHLSQALPLRMLRQPLCWFSE